MSRAGADNRQAIQARSPRDGGAASAYLLPQLFLWIGPRVFAYGPLQIRLVPAVGWQQVQRFRDSCRTAAFIHKR